MFAEFRHWADTVVRRRFTVIGVTVVGLLALGAYGLGLADRLSSSGWDDPTSESAQASRVKDQVFGHDHSADVVVLYNAPEGGTIDDPEFSRAIVDNLNSLPQRYPAEIAGINGTYWPTDTGMTLPELFGSADHKHAFASIAVTGNDDTERMRNFRKVESAFEIPGIDLEVAGAQSVGGALNDTMTHDQQRMELFAIPAVAVLLFFVFGGVIAAALPLIIGGLTVIGAWGIIRALTTVTEVNSFVSPVVSMIGLGLAIDYGLFIVSRFREELADGRDVPAAVRRSVQTAGRTVVFSATIVITAAAGILLFPQGFLRSFAYGSMVTVALAALTAVTVLPAMLAVLGHRVDWLGFRRARPAANAVRDNNIWGRIADAVMRRPLAVLIPVCAALVLLIAPVQHIVFGTITEKFLPPEHPARLAQQHFDEIFPLRQIDPVDLVMITYSAADTETVLERANQAPGLVAPFPEPFKRPAQPYVSTTSTVLAGSADKDATIDYLRSMPLPTGAVLMVGGQPAVEKDSVDALLARMPAMIAFVFLATTVLMLLSFGSLILPLKAALLNLLGLGSTLGVLTWIFVEGHGAGVLGFTPQPIMSLVLVLIVSVIYGLSTDYEVFLLARVVEARNAGASTTDAVRSGISRTGWIITAAALILIVVTGAFALSDLVMMQYIAFGMVTALFIDATILRMLLVPAAMRLLGEFGWWAPSWLRRRPAEPRTEPARTGPAGIPARETQPTPVETGSRG
ncbi:RND superfamily putative drug exporter [Nocardia transvalensis]|uniref:RND superfamily putative drug exporter n=1 Tax=Nocardia transvalensis TaxID=37333 RepID=A0A7W9PJR8_9NOCA|nr:MMPL family transporter [Nocardia transvalensis]MBB5917456.1 RND superfamily putative drug exporter [Nocardia transvalensis]